MENSIQDVINKVNAIKEFGLRVNKDFDSGIDKWLALWTASPVSGWIACGMGVALLAIGGFIGQIISKLL